MTLNKTRAWIAGAVVVSLLLAVAAWFLLISPKRAEAAESREMTVAAQSQNEQLRAEIEQLKKDFVNLPQYEAELAAIRRALPAEDQLNTLTRELEAQAGAANVQLFSIAPGTPEARVDQAAATAAAPAAAAPADGDAAAAPAAAATPAAATLVQIPVAVTVNGNFQNSEVFLRSLQQNISRDYLVTGLSIEPASDDPGFTPANGDVKLVITGYIFAYTETASPAGATAQAPAAAAATATPSATSSPSASSAAVN